MVVEDYITDVIDERTKENIIPFRKRQVDEIECLEDEYCECVQPVVLDEYECPDIDYKFISDCIIRDSTKQEILEYMLDLIKVKYGLQNSDEAVDNWGRFKKEYLGRLENI